MTLWTKLRGATPKPWIVCRGENGWTLPRAEFGVKLEGISSIQVAANVRLLRGATILANPGKIFLGERTVICRWAVVQTVGGCIEIGKRCAIGDNNTILGRGGLVIGDDVITAAGVRIATSEHDITLSTTPISMREEASGKVIIGNGVWIASNAVVTAGVSIGDGAVIGAGAVVTRDIPAGAVAVGVPARVVKMRS